MRRSFAQTFAIAVAIGLTAAARADNVMLDDHSSAEIRHLTKVAAEAVAAERWSQAVAIFQRMVEAPPEALYSDKPIEEGPMYYVGVRRYGMRQLSTLPAGGRQAYEARYGPVARRMIARAPSGAAGEASKRAIVVRYLFTEAADGVVQELAALSLERGEPERAAYWLDQLRAKYALKRFEPNWLAMLGFCYRASGQMVALTELAKSCKGRSARVTVGGEEVGLSAYLGGLQKELVAELSTHRDLDTWPLMGGEPSQGRIAPFDVSALKPAWGGRPVTIPQPSSPTVTRFRYARNRDLNYQGARQTPARCMPAVGDGKVFLSNGHIVYAYNLYNGEVAWQATPLVQMLNTPQDRMQSYSVTYHRGSVYAHIEPRNDDAVEHYSRYQIRTPLPRRALVRFDATSGKQLWDSRRPALGAKSLVNRVNICTAPLIRGDVAYCCGVFYEGLFHMYLMAFDTRNGDLLWSRHLGGGQQSLNLFGRPYREITYTMPAMSGGRLYICSNLGFVSCVDAEVGEVLWVRRYRRIVFRTTQTFMLPSVNVSWFSRPPIAVGGRVLFTPSDSQELLCLNAESGDIQWIQRGREHVLIGSVGGRVFTAGEQLKSYDLVSGRALGSRSLGAQALGLGALTETSGYLATTTGLVRFDPKTLQIRDRRALKSNGLLGNVVLAGNVMLVVGEGGNQRYAGEVEMLAYYDWDEMGRNLRAEVSRNPDHPFAYNVLAAITAQRKDYAGALALYEKALLNARRSSKREYRRAGRRAMTGLYNTFRARAETEKNAGRHERALVDLREAEARASGTSQRMRVLELQLDIAEERKDLTLLRQLVERIVTDYGEQRVRVGRGRAAAGLMGILRLAESLQKADRAEEAVDCYQRVLVRYARATYPSTRSIRALWPGGDAPRTVEGQQIASRAIDAAMHKHGSRIYRKHQAIARSRFELARKSGSINELEALLQHYPNSSVVPAATLLLSRRLIEADRPETRHALEARRLLLAFLVNAGGARAIEGRYLLFRAYDKDKMYPNAKGVLAELSERHGDAIIEGPPRIEIAEFVRDQLAKPEYRATRAAAPPPSLDLPSGGSALWRVVGPESAGLLRIANPMGDAPRALRDRFFLIGLGKIACRSAADGSRLIWERVVGTKIVGQLGWVGDTLIAFSAQGDVIGLDGATGDERWKRSLGWPIEEGRIERGVVAVVCAIRTRNDRGGRVALIDGTTGELAWHRWMPTVRNPSRPLIGRRHIVVWDSSSSAPSMALIELTTGKVSRPVELDRGALVNCPPVLIQDHGLIAVPLGGSARSYRLAIVDPVAGKAIKTITLGGQLALGGLIAGQRRFFVDYRDGQVDAFDHTGRRLWRANLNNLATWRIAAGDSLYILTSGQHIGGSRNRVRKTLVALEQATGEIQWMSQPQGSSNVRVLLSKRHLLTLASGDRSRTGRLFLTYYDRVSGKMAKVLAVSSSTPGVFPATLAGGRLILSVANNAIEGYGRASAKPKDKPVK